jgi:hypothetical protein
MVFEADPQVQPVDLHLLDCLLADFLLDLLDREEQNPAHPASEERK